MRRLSKAALLIACLWGAAGCQSSTKHYTLTGQVLAKNESAGQLSVDNDNIPGFMPAMTMTYPVKDPQGLQQVQPGDRITADVVVQNGGSNYWLQHVTITDQERAGFRCRRHKTSRTPAGRESAGCSTGQSGRQDAAPRRLQG